MSIHIPNSPLLSSRIAPSITIEHITNALLQLRLELEEINPLDKQRIPADQLLYDVCVVLDLPVLAINMVLGKDHNPYEEKLSGD